MNRKTTKVDNDVKANEARHRLVNNFVKIAADAAEKTKDIVAKTQESIVNVVDKNDNGKIDKEDFGLGEKNLQVAKVKVQKFASEASETIKTGSELVGQALVEAKIEMDRKFLRPVFAEELRFDAISISNIAENCKERNPNMICIVDRDKKRDENEACRGAVGYRVTVKGMEILNIYEDSAQQLEMKFCPKISKTIYYANPYQNNVYICLDEYFNYIKKARVNELEMVAQNLGAKRVQIKFKEQKKTFVTKNARADGKVEKNRASVSYDKADSEYSGIEIATDVKFNGHNTPVKTTLMYFKNESDIENLIQMRTIDKNNIKSKKYSLQCSKSSGIKEKEAAQIDAVLYQLKCSGTASISSEAQRESRTDLEYSIEF